MCVPGTVHNFRDKNKDLHGAAGGGGSDHRHLLHRIRQRRSHHKSGGKQIRRDLQSIARYEQQCCAEPPLLGISVKLAAVQRGPQDARNLAQAILEDPHRSCSCACAQNEINSLETLRMRELPALSS